MQYFINLFPEKEKDTADKVIYFAFHYLRYILVITQFVVICVFFFRFKVDQEIVDLKDGLQQKKQIILATSSLLDEMDYLDKETTNVAAIITEQSKFQTMTNYFIESLPSDIFLSSLSVSGARISCDGYSLNPASIQQYKEQLSREAKFEKITLSSVRKTDQGFTFSLELENFKFN